MFFSCHERGTKRKSEVPTTTGSKIQKVWNQDSGFFSYQHSCETINFTARGGIKSSGKFSQMPSSSWHHQPIRTRSKFKQSTGNTGKHECPRAKSRLALFLHLIRWDGGASSLDQSQSEVNQNQSLDLIKCFHQIIDVCGPFEILTRMWRCCICCGTKVWI